MKALVYHGPKKVSVDTVPDAKIEKQTPGPKGGRRSGEEGADRV
jgi:Alcohol dehydrogenase GroES-associated